MTIPASSSSLAFALARQDGNGKLAAGMGGVATTLATLDANTRVVEPVQLVANAVPSSTVGSIGMDSGKLKFGNGATVDQAEVVSQKGANGGYAGLDGSGLVAQAAKKVKTGSSSGTTSGAIAVNNGDLTFGEGANERTVENTSRKGQNNGYAGLDNTGKVQQEPASKGANNGIASLDGSQLVVQAIKLVQVGAATTTNGSIGVDGTDHDLKFGEGANVRVVENTSRKGIANGYAALDGSGKVPAGQLPASVVGAMSYVGGWNAGTNTPDISASPAKGQFWIVTGAGVVGGTDYKVGDWAVWDGAAFDKIDNTDQVASVFGRTGTVSAQSGDYSIDQITNGASTSYVDSAAGSAQANAESYADGLAGNYDAAGAAATAQANAEGYTDTAVAGILDGCDFTGPIQTSGHKVKVRTLTGTAGVVVSTDDIVRLNGAAGPCDVALPDATLAGTLNMSVRLMAVDVTNTCRVLVAGTDTINGVAAHKTLSIAFEGYEFVCVASGKWEIW